MGAGGLGTRNFEWALILGVERGKVTGHHTCQELGTLVGGQSSRPGHHTTGNLCFGRLSWGTHVFPSVGTVD